jgi:hypothetical protein
MRAREDEGNIMQFLPAFGAYRIACWSVMSRRRKSVERAMAKALRWQASFLQGSRGLDAPNRGMACRPRPLTMS